jgi:hypothetical protein
MREYTKTLTDDNTRNGGRTITAENAYNAHTRPLMPSLADMTAKTRNAATRALDVLTGR